MTLLLKSPRITLLDSRKLFKSTLNNRLRRNLACVIDKSSRGAKLKRAFEELPQASDDASARTRKSLQCMAYKPKHQSSRSYRLFAQEESSLANGSPNSDYQSVNQACRRCPILCFYLLQSKHIVQKTRDMLGIKIDSDPHTLE